MPGAASTSHAAQARQHGHGEMTAAGQEEAWAHRQVRLLTCTMRGVKDACPARSSDNSPTCNGM